MGPPPSPEDLFRRAAAMAAILSGGFIKVSPFGATNDFDIPPGGAIGFTATDGCETLVLSSPCF